MTSWQKEDINQNLANFTFGDNRIYVLLPQGDIYHALQIFFRYELNFGPPENNPSNVILMSQKKGDLNSVFIESEIREILINVLLLSRRENDVGGLKSGASTVELPPLQSRCLCLKIV